MLKEIKGEAVTTFPFGNLRLIADLLYFDGPLLSYFKDQADQGYLYYWCDVDEQHNRWLLLPVTKPALRQFLTQQLSLHSLLLTAPPAMMYLVDLDQALHPQGMLRVNVADLPPDYLPEPETYYDASLSVFHDEAAARELLVLMQHSLQEVQTKLKLIEQILVQPVKAIYQPN